MYKKEIKLGETVVCKYKKLENQYMIVIKSKDENIVHAMVVLS